MSILSNWFGGSQNTQAQQQQTQQTQQEQQTQQVQQQEPELSPEEQLAAFASIEVKPEEQFDPSKLFNVDPAKMQEEVARMNFLEGAITKEQLAKIQEGGDGAQVVMLEVMNNMARQLFAKSAQLSTAVTTNALSNSLPHVQQMMGKSLNEAKLHEAIEAVNPALASPMGKLFLKDIMPRLQVQHPKATNKELAEFANQKFIQFATQVNPQAPSQEETRKAQETDWNAWLEQ